MDSCPMDFQGPWLPVLFVLFSVYPKKVRARDLQARSTGHDLTVSAPNTWFSLVFKFKGIIIL